MGILANSILGFVAALLVLSPTATACHATMPQLGSWEDSMRLYVESSGASGFLSLDPDAGSATSLTAFDATTGPVSSAQSVAAPAKTSITLKLDPVVATDFYLNLSKPVVGRIFWSSTTQEAAGRDPSQFRIELYNGSERIGGDECVYPGSVTGTRWVTSVLKFRPEGLSFHKGDQLSVKITRLSGAADFRIGTGGPEQSYLEIRGYPFDPLKGTVYLENRKLVGLPGTEALDEDVLERLRQQGAFEDDAPQMRLVSPSIDTPGARWSGLAAGLGLLAMGRRRQGRALLVGLALVAGAMSGCLDKTGASGAAEAEDAPAKPTAVQEIREDRNLTSKETGVIEGTVRDEAGIPQRGAHVALLGTSSSATTNTRGEFVMRDIAANEYMVRVDLAQFDPLEQKIQVQGGKVTLLNITLVRQGAKTSGAKPHIHDVWGGDVKKELWKAEVVPSSGLYSATGGPTGHAYCPWFFNPACEAPIPINYDQPVPPGTSMVEIKMHWEPPVFGANELGLHVLTTAGNKSGDQVYLFRGPGEPFRIAIFPNEADPGHQGFTEWTLNVRAPGNQQLAHPVFPLVSHTRKVVVTAVAYKGVVPYEPSHQDFWNGRDQIPLFEAVKKGPGVCALCDMPYTANNLYYWSVEGQGMVPPGTKEVRGTMTWENPTTANQGTGWKLAYKGGNSPAGRPVFQKPQSMTPGTNKLDFVIVPDPRDTDQFYQTKSNWIFYPDDNEVPTCPYYGTCYSPNTGYGTSWTLTATAHRDPAYVPPT